MIVVEGLRELTVDLETKAKGIYGETMHVLWGAADRGARIAASNVRGRSDRVADSMSPATYGYPWRTRQGARAVWGPTEQLGRLLATGTPNLSPSPYLEQSLNSVASDVMRSLEQIAGEL